MLIINGALAAALSVSPLLVTQQVDGLTSVRLVKARNALHLQALQILQPSAGPLDLVGIQDREQHKPFCCAEHKVGVAVAEMIALQVLPWYVNRHVADDSTAVLSFDSWKRNLELGFEWDPNDFITNVFAHPYHGNTYFNSARTNGYSYWESVAFTWLGSMLWEFFGENNPGAINDWINTSLGGIMLGEVAYRGSVVVLDNTAVGGNRAWRELVGFLVNPVGALNRLFRGEMTRVGTNPAHRTEFRSPLSILARAGVRAVTAGEVEEGRTGVYVELDAAYGDPLRDFEDAFDSFRATAQFNMNDGQGRIQIEGSLAGAQIVNQPNVELSFVINQHYDYINTDAYELGGQSVSAGAVVRRPLGRSMALVGKAQITASMISAISTDYPGDNGRGYDFGTGAGTRVYATLTHQRREIASAFYIFNWSHTLNGAAGNHLLHFMGANLEGPSAGRIGIGAQFIYIVRQSNYRDFLNVGQHNTQFRAYTKFRLW